MKMGVILISSVASPTGYLLAKELKETAEIIIGMDSKQVEFPHGEFYKCPPAKNSGEFKDFLTNLISFKKIQQIIFCNDHELSFLSKDESGFFQNFLIPPRDKIILYIDKLASYRVAQNAGFDVPKLFHNKFSKKDRYFLRNSNSAERPKLAKGITGGELETMDLDYRKKLIITEYLEGEEFTADCYFNPLLGVCEVAIRERLKVIDGVCTEGRLIDNPLLEMKLKKFVTTNDLRGFSSTQFIRMVDKYYYIETNTRAGGGTNLSLRGGLINRIRGEAVSLRYNELIIRNSNG